MFTCVTSCYDGTMFWSPGDISAAIPRGMDKYFRPSTPEEIKAKKKVNPKDIVALSQFVRPAFEVNPSEKIAISQYGKPQEKPQEKKKK